MNIGKLRHKIELQNYVTTTDSVGQQIRTWITYATVWSWIRPISGRELMNAQQPVGEITHKVTIRYNSSLDESHRIKYYDDVKETYRYFDVNFIGNYDERNEYQEIICKEKVDG